MAFKQFRAFACLIILMLLGFPPQQTTAQGLFSELKNSVRKPHPEKTKEKRENYRSTEPFFNHSFGERFSDLVGVAFFVAATTPVALPISIAKDNYKTQAYFPGYPYQDDARGYMLFDRPSQNQPFTSEPFNYSIQSSFDYTYYSSEISKTGTRFLIDTTSRFGIDSEFSYWNESLPGSSSEDYWAGDTNVIFRFAQTESFQMRTGIGFNWLSDEASSDFGFNFTYKGDFFPIDPLVLSAELDLGKIGSATLSHLRLTTGLNYRHAEIFIGYDHFRLAETEFNGFISGIRIWF